MEELIICVWPGYDWCAKDEVEKYAHLGDDYMELTVPDFVAFDKVDLWLEKTKPQDSAIKLKQYMVAKCKTCGELHFEPQDRHTAVMCDVCGKMHLSDSKTYIAVSGNVTVGMSGGLIGNNLNDQDVVKNVSIFCHHCFTKACTVQSPPETEEDEILKENSNITCPHGGIFRYLECAYTKTCINENPITYELCKKESS